jgi:hypothetical protein
VRRLFATRKRRLLVGIAATLLIAGGAAAYFTSSGHGSGTAVAASVQAVTFTPAIASSGLYPGTSGDVALTVSNPNGASVRIPSLLLDTSQGTGGFAVDNGHSGCSVSALSFNAANATTGWTVPANASAYAIDIGNGVTLATSAANACQGATFTVYLKVGP